jgi:uncharacterized protein YfaS (alpha-2-macroglobulin family)
MNAYGHSTAKQMIRVGVLVLALTALACSFPGCGQQGTPQPTPRPTVDVASLPPTTPRIVAQRPYPGEELPLDGSIDIYFDQPMDKASVEAALRFEPSLQFTLLWVDDSTLRVTPAAGQLQRAARYSVIVGAGARSADGLQLAEDTAFEVQTVGFLEVSEIIPADGATSVETESVITVLFNRPVVPLVIAEDMPGLPQPLSFSPDIPGQGQWINTSIYQWKPAQPLAGDTTYTVTVNAGLTDQTGGVLEQSFSWSFTTLLPDVAFVTPASGQGDVPLDTPVEIMFNQPMDRASTQSAFTLTNTATGQTVSGSFSWDETGKLMTFTPSGGRLALDGTYTAVLNAGARSASGPSTLPHTYSWSFSTVRTLAVSSTQPSNGQQDAYPWGGLRITFTAPVDEDTLTDDKLIVEPALPDDATFYYSGYDWSWNVSAALEPSTTYTVTLRPGVADPYGNTISQPYTFTFTTGPLDPLVQFNVQDMYGLYDASRTTELFVLYRNVSRIDFQLARLSADEFGRLSRTGSYADFQEFQPSPQQLIRSWSIQSEGALNEAVYVRVPVVGPGGGSLDPGFYLLIADAPEIEGDIRHFMIVVNANLTFKDSFDESLVWLTNLQTGQPIAGAPVTFYDEGFRQIGRGVTGADGVIETPMPHLDYLWTLRYAVVDDGNIFAVAVNGWSEGIQSWEFGLPSQYEFQNFSLYIYTDRPIYRPGQEVYFRGVLRAKNDVAYSLPAQTQVTVQIINDQGEEVSTQNLPVNEYGTFNGSFTLSDDASLGYYTIQVEIGGVVTGRGFQVAAYRRPEYLVNLTPAQDAVVDGDTITVTVDAQFFFGGPVSDAEVSWVALSDVYFFDYQGAGNYSFTDYDWDEQPQEEVIPGFGEQIASGTGRTGADGRFIITLPADLSDVSTSRRFTIEATVTDTGGQSVSGRAEVIVHKGRYYAGVSPDVYVGIAGERQSASLIVVDWDGQPVRNQRVTVQVVERRWSSVREEDEFGRTQWVWNVEEIPVGDPINVTTDAQGRANVSFVPPAGGTYKIRASVTDPQGRTTTSSAFMWISGAEYVSWRQANNNRIDLIADRTSYEPGDTAEILITSPFQGNSTRALITIERGSILSYQVITLPSNSYVYRLSITPDFAPNVYVSVVLIQGVNDTNPLPAFRMGMVELQVDPVQQTVQLTVTPDRDMVGPGEDVTYTITAADYQGNPVDAEVSLALVDLATLSLAPPNSGPIVEHFYGPQGLGVRTAVPLVYLVDRLNQELFDQGKGGGGGGEAAFFDIRTQFEDTAYWSATVRTGRDGRAEVTITLPDNLTTWRMDARAVTKNTLVGQAEVDIIATRPLLIRPQTPRFFVAEDEATLSAVVNNNTENNINATVTLQAQGVMTLGDVEQRVSIPAGGRVEVSWPVRVNADAEWVDLVFSVTGGGLSDASRPPVGDPDHNQMLPVYHYEVPETVGTAGQLIEAGSRVEGVVLPPTYDVTQGNLTVQIDPSLAATTLSGLTWLEHYPYECTEQTVSRFLPNALTLVALRRFNLSNAELEANLQRQVSIGLQKLYAQQHADGGWGWFVESPSNPTVTAYVVQGLMAVRQAGIAVDEQVVQRAVAYLKGQLGALTTLDAQYALHRQAYILYVLAKAGQPDVSRTVQLYEARAGMQHWAQALLAQTLWMIDPSDGRLVTLQSDLTNSAILSATGAHWEEDSPDSWNWNTDTRSTAIILDTFALLWPNSDLAPNIVRWLMVARQGGHWETTQETAWALIGLTDWMTATGELDASYSWDFLLNGQSYASGQASPETVRTSTEVTIGVTDLLADHVNRLTFVRAEGTGRLYYTAHLTAYLPVEEVEPLSRGVIVSRRYLDANGQPVTEGRVGDILTVELTIIAPHDMYYVVVTDPYPAGAEAIDVGLLTESVLGQRPVLQPTDPLAEGWGWWWFSQTDLRDEKAVLFADYLPAGTYQYTYQIRLGVVGTFRVIPPVAQEFYFPEVYGRGAGMLFTVLPAQ